MNNTVHSIILVLVAAGITVILRAAPFAIFSGKRQMPENARKTADMIPPAIMAVLVIYCIKSDILNVKAAVILQDMSGIAGVVAAAAALALVVLAHLWKRQTLLSIASGTALYMVLIRVLPGILN